MGELPEGRKPLTWKDMTPRHSSWEAEAKALRAENERLRAALTLISEMSHSDTCSTELTFMGHACDCHVQEACDALEDKT